MATLTSTGRFAAGEACADNDILYGPYATIAAAHAALLNAERNVVGRTVGIQTGNTIEEYWYQGGTTEQHLVKKQTASVEVDSELSSTSENPVQNKVVKSALDAKGTYSKPSGGIPKTDLASGVQASLDNADTALQQHQDISGKADKVNNATNGNFAGLDANGNLTNSTYKAADFATASQGAKADNAVQMPTGGSNEQILAKDSNETAGVKWVPKPSDGKSAYQVAVDNGFVGSESEWLASLKAQFGSFVPADYGTDGKPASGGTDIAASASTTNYIYLVDNAASTPTAKVMWITVVDETDPSNPTYSWQSIGEVQVNVNFASTQPLNSVSIVNDLTTGGADDVLSAEQGKVLEAKIEGVEGYVDQTVTLNDNCYYKYNSSYNRIDTTPVERDGTKCCMVTCNVGDKFKIYGRGTQTIRLYAFTDSSNTLLLCNTETTDWRNDGGEVTAPTNAAKLFINFEPYDSTNKIQKYYVELGLEQRVQALEEDIQALEENTLSDSDVIDNLTTDNSTKPLSAKQGKVLNEQINGVVEKMLISGIVEHTYINLKSTSSNGSQISTSGLTWDCASLKVNCQEGDKFEIYGYGRNNIIRLYAFASSSGYLIEKSIYPLDTREDGIIVTAPEGSAYLYINFYGYNNLTDKAYSFEVVQSGVNQKIDDIENKISKTLPIYSGKKFIVFGDSVTEFDDAFGYRWTDYAETILDCTMVNCAIGGSHMNDRRHTELFDPSHTYAVGDYVLYKPSDTMNIYRCISAHSGAWDAANFEDKSSDQSIIGSAAYDPIFTYRMIKAFCNIAISDPYERFKDQIASAECIYTWKSSHDDNRAIIQRLVDTDPKEIDAIIIAEGTNDYEANGWWGTTGSYDTNYLLGAINESIRLLNSVYPSCPVFYVTPTVRWYDYWGGSGTPSKFSDSYNRNGEISKTFKEYVHEVLMNEYINNHVPCVNLYDELQWTMYNFSNYFNDNDGTHPKKGFYNIAQKISSFLIANKNF